MTETTYTEAIEQARDELNRWEFAVANDPGNQEYIRVWAEARGLDFVDVYTFLINEHKAAQLEAWGFGQEGAWEIAATKTQWHRLMRLEGRPVALAEVEDFVFGSPEYLSMTRDRV